MSEVQHTEPKSTRRPGFTRPGWVTAHESRLEISEALNRLPDAIECARTAVEWLARTAGATQVLCAARGEGEPNRLVVRASHGFTHEEVLLLSRGLADARNPIVLAVTGAEKVAAAGLDLAGAWTAGPGAPSRTMYAALLRAADRESVGVLVISPAAPDVVREALWLASILGPRISAHRALVTAERFLSSLSRERELLQRLEENVEKLAAAEAQASAERDRLDMILDSVGDPIVATGPSGEVIHVNPPADRFLTPPVGRGARNGKRFARENSARLMALAAELLGATAPPRHRRQLVLVDPATGAPIPFEACAGRIDSERGDPTAVVMVLHDRTEAIEKARLYETVQRASRTLEQKVDDATAELVRQNEVLRRQHIALEQASQLKSLFLANMSHEFRTPLNAILGYTNMLLEGVGGRLAATHRRNLARIDSNAQHLSQIIADILDISKIEAGKMPLNLTTFTLAELLAEVMEELDPLIARSTLQVSVRTTRRIPALYSDRAKIKQVVLNLLGNAIKFTQQGSVRISARHDRGRDAVLVAVQDTGIGIAIEDQEAVFEDFRQVDSSTTREYQGTGLGLSICRRLAKALGGHIQLKSALGEGSTFTLVVPRRFCAK